MTNPSTLSPRNSSRSYDSTRSSVKDGWRKTCSRRTAGRALISRSRAAVSPLLVRRDVVDGLPDGLDLLRVLVRDLDPELILQLHDQLDEVEGVGVEILLEGGLLGDLAVVDAELVDEHFLDPVEDFLTRSCHLTSFRRRGPESAPMLPRAPRCARPVVRPPGARR